MNSKKKVKVQYYLLSAIGVIISLIGIIAFNIGNMKLGSICLVLLVVFIIIWRIWGKHVSKEHFNGQTHISKEEIDNIDK